MGKSTVFVNSQGMSSTGSGAVTVSGPDVCLTPMGSSVVPIPYTNTARSATLADGTKTVTIDGSMGAIQGCSYSKSTGDEAGSAKGVMSGTVANKAEFINYSFDVKIEGRGACRNTDAMTHNNKNALGMNQDSASPPASGVQQILPDKTTLRVKVVEYLSWDFYDEEKGSFRPGHESNQSIAGRKVNIKMPDGSIIEKTTDENGIIELIDLEATAKFEIVFEPEEVAHNNNESFFYNRTAVVKTEL